LIAISLKSTKPSFIFDMRSHLESKLGKKSINFDKKFWEKLDWNVFQEVCTKFFQEWTKPINDMTVLRVNDVTKNTEIVTVKQVVNEAIKEFQEKYEDVLKKEAETKNKELIAFVVYNVGFSSLVCSKIDLITHESLSLYG
jgi:hypothetical protein